MMTTQYLQKYKTELFFYFGFLTILGIAFFLQTIYIEPLWSKEEEPFTTEIILNVFIDRVVAAYLWLFLTPFIIWIAEKIAEKKISFLKTISLHVLAGLFFTFTHIPIYSAYVFTMHAMIPWMYIGVFERFPDVSFFDYIFQSITRLNHVYRLLYYSIIIAIHFAFDYFRKYSERELRASQLEVQLKESQIRTLHQQLQPHFLFNTLNGISSLMYKSVDEADKMLTYLGDLLRISLERMNVQEVPLKDDIAFIERYLLIEKTRMGDRLIVKTNFHPDTLDALVPCMMAQPILENAIKHGIAPNVKQGTIIASSWRHAEKLYLQIEDDGKGLDKPIEQHLTNGYGIKNTLERLNILYSNNYSFTFTNRETGGLRVTLCIPFRMNTE
ncbi:MAG: histidine kinase [Ignavibacteriales bacterium]|nr:histidine kinase [Ignavibacteriales bacterium]